MLKDKKLGFTLIELLIVIGIIAILATAVIIAINPGEQFKEARNATRRSHMNAIANGIYGYVIKNGDWPECMADAEACEEGAEHGTCGEEGDEYCPFIDVSDCADELVPTYLPSIPSDPLNNNSYRIRFYSGESRRIQICPPADAIDDATEDTGIVEVVQ